MKFWKMITDAPTSKKVLYDFLFAFMVLVLIDNICVLYVKLVV